MIMRRNNLDGSSSIWGRKERKMERRVKNKPPAVSIGY